MLFLEQRGEFLVATIKHGLQTQKPRPITIIKKQQFQVLSSRILRKWFEKEPQLMLQKEPNSAKKKDRYKGGNGIINKP